MPHASVDSSGTTHLMYFVGAMTGGDLHYASLEPDGTTWSSSIRVNSRPRAAIGRGPMDGGDMALSQPEGRRIHVVWYLTHPLRILYTRSNIHRTDFEPQRTIWEPEEELMEARPSITVDERDRVLVAWHGATIDGTDDANRAVYLMTSNDGGDTFELPRIVSDTALGACGCCSLDTFTAKGHLWISYRSAGNNVDRDQHLLTSSDGGHSFTDNLLEPWPIGACPVTTTTFGIGLNTVRVAWETNGRITFSPVDALAIRSAPQKPARFRQKNPAVATNRAGRTLLAWGDAPGYRAGGTLSWQEFDADGNPLSRIISGTHTIPSGSGPAVVTRSDDSFVVIY